ncbi:DUF4252 domain-containing protein [Hymenobacter sp. BT770]|uniref:DUF4252 domain-containing protein n=1 Tax=Hymenobacter sp. BT770 TaxID=2886942 RepID=UPI001D12DBB9|nr:DUF4252 domain-containing protein [Hymenobacter sp. BT770]MCC3152850.1 DUF4252 domain-containing protein [Hymenobacter sp. BT770]MDO3414925.1 DUF4252 domain-containing protein [Hymenobacter sp. BT770]
MITKLRLPALFLFLLMVGCRAGGPGTPARTVASFFSKYEGREGFKTTEWSADLLQRLALVKAAKLLGGSDLTDAITGIRSAKVISFAPTSGSARELAQQGLRQEATGILQGEKYTPLSTAGFGGSDYAVSTRGSGDKVSEFAALGSLPDVADSFVLVSVQGNFTSSQVAALSKYLPQIVQATSK